jgi:hypothetical protein
MKSENFKFLGAFLLVVLMVGFVSAEFSIMTHDAEVTLSPEIASCGDVANEFTVNIENTDGYGIYNVKIYEAETNIEELTCGPAPDGFSFLGFQYDSYCEYETDPYGEYPIEDGEDVDFTFDAVLSQEDCVSTFIITTLDNEGIIGEGEGIEVETELELIVDCEIPVITKTIGDPKVAGDITNFLWWITQDSLFEVDVTEYDECDLGLDYCLIKYTLDGDESFVIVDADGLDGALDWSYEWDYDEDSEHFLEILCYDLAGNVASHNQTEKVDDTPPVTTKMYGLPSFAEGGDINDEGTHPHYITTSTPITLSAIDLEADTTPDGVDCSIDNVNIFYRTCQEDCYFEVDDFGTVELICGDECSCDEEFVLYYEPFTIPEESEHCIEFYSVDGIGNEEDHQVQCVYVEDQPPAVDKDNGNALLDGGEPLFTTEDNMKGVFHWIKTDMPVTFTCTDPEPHPSAHEEVCFKVSYDYPIWGYITDSYCDGDLEDGYCCVDATPDFPFEFYFQEESMHNLEYYCRDALGHESDEHIQYYKVDDTAPILIEKIIDGPSIALQGMCPPRPGSDDICHIDGVTTIDIDVEDGGDICAVGIDECRWKYSVYNEFKGWSSYYGWYYDFPINFPEESKHELVIECEDWLGNIMTDVEIFYVDKTAPDTTFSVIGPQIPNPITEDSVGYPRWIDTVSRIEFSATDDIGPHDSGVYGTYYRVTQQIGDYYCEDEYSCTHAVGSGDFVEYDVPFGISESCHLIEYYSVDNVNKIEDIERQCVFSDHTAPVAEIVDVVGPILDCEDGEGCDYWVADHRTDIYLQCRNGIDEPHPAPLDELFWRITIDGVPGDWSSQAVSCPVVVTFLEDSVHELEYYCTDKVDKVGDVGSTIFRVDSVAPEITKIMHGPYTGICPPVPGVVPMGGDDECFVDDATSVEIQVSDPDPTGYGCAVGGETCKWRYRVWDVLPNDPQAQYIFPDWGNWNYDFTIIFPEESYHEVEVYCEDALGNWVSDVEWFSADHTVPMISKAYGEPYEEYRFEEYWAKWISSDTPIFGEVIDAGPHMSGIKEVKYRTFVVDDEDCKYYYPVATAAVTNGVGSMYDHGCDEVDDNDTVWTTVDPADYADFEFNIPEDSCHLIEIMATDNVDKCNLHKQWIYVDNMPPTPNKTVGEPGTEWYPVDVADNPLDPDATHFYPWIVDRCWNGENDSIDCWKVTLDTKISMECIDPEPHPVGDERVCFNVELDAEDATGQYCRMYGGDYIYDEEYEDDYCCVDRVMRHFKFMEESEHNLKYYCEDALGNKGPIDDEKFKVTGELFKIQLNDKWNLISVPFALLNDNPEEVFEDTESVKTVWSYEDGAWKVYRPGELTNNLDKIQPGLGYWILADCNESTNPFVVYTAEDIRGGCGPNRDRCEMLVVGGSLYNAGPVLPPSQQLQEGWNLIGYYGTEGRKRYVGPDGAYFIPETKEAYCALYSLRNLDGGLTNPTKWTSLIGYWEPYNPNQWDELGYCDEMDPGAGYWLFMSEDGRYAPETVCDQSFAQELMCDLGDLF